VRAPPGGLAEAMSALNWDLRSRKIHFHGTVYVDIDMISLDDFKHLGSVLDYALVTKHVLYAACSCARLAGDVTWYIRRVLRMRGGQKATKTLESLND
jgi:hypothetical protein